MADGKLTEVADDAVNALKSSPATLGLLLLNVVFLAAAAYFLHDLVSTAGARQTMILERCLPHGQ